MSNSIQKYDRCRVSTSKMFITILMIYFWGSSRLYGQYDRYNHPELHWKVLTTEHFQVIYHTEAEWTARKIAAIAENVWEPITELYQYRPEGKVYIIVRDHDDFSNGATYYYQQKIEIWATPLDFELRGNHHWLTDVVTHEFIHLVQLGASRKGPRNLPNIYLQSISYEPERRPDVLYGYPHRLISFPIMGTVIPMWFAEGVCQYGTQTSTHDWWDSHRDMILRVRSIADNLLTLNQMEVFGKNTLESELVYCQGFSLVRFIANNWGDEALRNLSRAMRSPMRWDFSYACLKVLGISDRQLYQMWKNETKNRYLQGTSTLQEHRIEGETISLGGNFNLYPRWSPNGKQIAFISNQGKDYLSQASLTIYQLDRQHLVTTPISPNTPFDWSPDGRYILYSQSSHSNRHGSHFSDLFLWKIGEESKKKIHRLTRDGRLWSPTFSPDGHNVVAVHNRDGTLNLALISLPNTLDAQSLEQPLPFQLITSFTEGYQVFRPRYSPDGEFIYFSATPGGDRDIYRLELKSGEIQEVLVTPSDERDPEISTDGRYLYFSSDRSGIFNIYRLETSLIGKFLDSETLYDLAEPLTNVIGGAFSPDLDSAGNLVFSSFTANGFTIQTLPSPQPLEPNILNYTSLPAPLFSSSSAPEITEISPQSYTLTFDKLFLAPRIAWDYQTFKPGFYAYTEDILGKVALEGGLALNKRGDRDLFARVTYHITYPTLYIEGYNITRHRHLTFDDPWVIVGERWEKNPDGDSLAVPIYGTYGIDYTFSLGEVDVGATYPINARTDLSLQFRLDRYTAALHFEAGSSFNYTYHKGNAYILSLGTDKRERSATGDIHPPSGWRGSFTYAFENNRFLTGFKVDADRFTIQEVYQPNRFHRWEGRVEQYIPIGGNIVLQPATSLGVISSPVDPFYHLYAGGLNGLKGYSYFSLGGTRRWIGGLYLRFPLFRNIDHAISPFYLDQVYGAIFTELGDAWRGNLNHFKRKRDGGFEVRIRMFSWYGIPTAISFIGAYGWDKTQVAEQNWRATYGKEWRYYLTILFDFFTPVYNKLNSGIR